MINEQINSTMINNLPSFSEVFFVHYQCDDFNIGTKIYNLGIYSKGKAKEFADEEEHIIIEKFCAQVKELCFEGLIPVSWNQNRPYFGPDMIMKRYKQITGKEIELEYVNEIILSDLLIEIYGDDYVSHPRLDNLAELNQCFGSSKDKVREQIFSVDRILLLSKIYHKLLHKKLIIKALVMFGDIAIPHVAIATNIIPIDDIQLEPKALEITKMELLSNHLRAYGIYDIPKIKVLSSEKQMQLIELLLINKLPYCIAMLDFLDYVKFLDKIHFKNIKSRNVEIANWFDSNDRAVRGNINILIDYSDENNNRYTSNKHEESVENDYNDIK